MVMDNNSRARISLPDPLRESAPVAGHSATIDYSHHDGEETRSAKRRKEKHVRTRVSRACDRCKSRKTRCSGKYPCSLCFQLGLDCQFTAAYRRGRLPSIELRSDDSADNPVGTPAAEAQHSRGPNVASGSHTSIPIVESMPDSNLVSVEPHPAGRGNGEGPTDSGRFEQEPTVPSVEHLQTINATADPTATLLNGTASVVQSSRNSPEPSQNDLQGHYVGPASGASFMLRLQRKLKLQQTFIGSECSIFTFGDCPLPDYDHSFFILPPRTVAEALLAKYFDFAAATHRFLHRQTVEKWLRELYDTEGEMRQKQEAHSRTALLFMVFAHTKNYMKSKEGENTLDISTRFFSAAEHQLSIERGEIRLTSVQARLAQCLYLLSHSRINHCWSLFGTTAHLVLALGLHRKQRIDQNNVDYVDVECRRRTFWCAYNLDTYLSAALGRPRTFHDEDIDQEFPSCVNDNDLTMHRLQPAPIKSQSIMSGSIAHIKLSRIIANILRDMYSIRPLSMETRLKMASKYYQELREWRQSLKHLLDTDSIDPSFFLPVFLRQRNVLNLAYWHGQILLYRPFLLSNFAGLAHRNRSSRSSRNRFNSDKELEKRVQQCLEAALNVVRIVDELSSTGQLYSTFWFTHYFAFCAVVVLYVYIIQERDSNPERYPQLFHSASKCQHNISNIASKGSLGERYGFVLEELRLEVLRNNHRLASHEDVSGIIATSMLPNPNHPTRNAPQLGAQGGSHDPINIDHILAPQQNQNNLLQIDAGAGAAANEFGQVQDFLDGSPSSTMTQLIGWGQFDSLVSGGVGGMNALLADGISGWDLGYPGDMDNLA